MRRGLKSGSVMIVAASLRRSKERPDEKGTEIWAIVIARTARGVRNAPMRRGLRYDAWGPAASAVGVSNRPDEKGTEMQAQAWRCR